jgi:hypothetical protein
MPSYKCTVEEDDVGVRDLDALDDDNDDWSKDDDASDLPSTLS